MISAAYLHEYIEFARTMSYAEAARALFVSQPTLRAHIRALEGDVGAPFTARHNGQLHLTSTGRFVLERAREVVRYTDDAFEACRLYARNHASIMVGGTGVSAVLDCVERARMAYCSRHPEKNLDVRISSRMSSNLEAVRGGDVDLILLSRVPADNVPRGHLDAQLPDGFRCTLIKSTRLLFWADASSSLCSLSAVHAADLAGHTLLLGTTENMRYAGEVVGRLLSQRGIDVPLAHEPFNNYSEYLFAGHADSFGVTLGESTQPRSSTFFFELADLPIACELYLLFNAACLKEDAEFFFETLVTDLREALRKQ